MSKAQKPLPKRPKQDRRECAADGCSTLLSRYNLGDYCFSHDNPRDDRMLPRNMLHRT